MWRRQQCQNNNITLEQPLQRTLPGTGGIGGRGGAGAIAESKAGTGIGGLRGRGVMACRIAPLPGIEMAA